MRHGFPLFLCKNIHSIPYPIESSILVPFMAMRIIIPRSHAELEEGLLPLGRIRHSQTEEKSQKHLHCNSMYRGIVYGHGQNLSGNAIRKQFYFYFDSKKNCSSLFQILLHTNKPAIKDSCCEAGHCIIQEWQSNGTAKCSAKKKLTPRPQPIASPSG